MGKRKKVTRDDAVQKAEEAIRKARAGLVFTHPFFGLISTKLTLVATRRIPTIGTDGKRLAYNPEFVLGLPFDHLKGILAHEVMHVVCMHHLRRGEREPERWNIAGDHIVNGHVLKANFNLPEDRLHNPEWDDKWTEHVYAALGQPPPPQDDGEGKGKGGGAGQPGEGDPGGEGEGDSQEDPQDNEGQDEPQKSQEEDSPNEDTQDKEGEGQEDSQMPESCGDPGGCGEVFDLVNEDGTCLSRDQMEQEEQELKASIVQAAHMAKEQGKLPAGVERLIDEMTETKVPWRDVLARFVTEIARNDYSWRMPNRRYLSQGIYLPELRNEELGKVVLMVDTSGSIGKEDMEMMAGEMSGLLQEYEEDAELLVIYCDAAVAGTQTITVDDVPVKLTPAGGGGTDFRPPFAYLEEEGIEPIASVYFTDGYCSSFPEEPEHSVLWALNQRNEGFKPPFGETVVIED